MYRGLGLMRLDWKVRFITAVLFFPGRVGPLGRGKRWFTQSVADHDEAKDCLGLNRFGLNIDGGLRHGKEGELKVPRKSFVQRKPTLSWPGQSLASVDPILAANLEDVTPYLTFPQIVSTLDAARESKSEFVLDRANVYVVECLMKHKRSDIARQLVAHFEPASLEAYAVIIFDHGQKGLLTQMMELVDEAKARVNELHPRFYEVVIRSLMRHMDIIRALEYYEEMERANFRASYSLRRVMCAGLCNAGDFEKGDTFLPHDESKLGIFMNELMRSGKPNMAIRVFGKYTQGENAIAPSIVTMNILLKALDRANRFAEAQEVFLQLKQERNARTYQIYTAILARRKKTDELVRVAQMMLKDGLVPTEDFYARLPLLVAESHNVVTATKVLDNMVANGMTVTIMSYRILIADFGRRGDVQSVEHLFKHLEEAGLKADVNCYNGLLYSHIQALDVQGTKDVLRRMQENEINANSVTFMKLISLYASIGDLDAVDDLLVEAKRKGFAPGTRAYHSILIPLMHARRTLEVRKYLANMLEASIAPTRQTALTLFHYSLRENEIKQAMIALDMIDRMNLESEEKTEYLRKKLNRHINADRRGDCGDK